MNLFTKKIICQFNTLGSYGIDDISCQGALMISKNNKDMNQDRLIINALDNREVKKYPLNTEEKNNPNSEDTLVKFFPDGKKFLSINGNTANIWDISKLTSSVQDAAMMNR